MYVVPSAAHLCSVLLLLLLLCQAAVGPGRGDARHGGEDDVRPAAEIHGPAHVRGAEETGHPPEVRTPVLTARVAEAPASPCPSR